MDQSDYLPLRMVNQVRYCERRFWYMHVLAEMEINAPVLEGTLQHERAHQVGATQAGQASPEPTVIHRRMWLWSDRLQVIGMGDVVEEQAGVLYPVEYKRGRLGRWDNDQVQLCAQAVCLEERFGIAVPHGAIFYHSSRHRLPIVFDAGLRTLAGNCIARAFELIDIGRIPPPLPHDQRARCHECSLAEQCMPDEVLLLSQ